MLTNGQKLFREILGLCFIFCGLFIIMSLWTYSVKDPTLNQTVSGAYTIQNAGGKFGAYLAGLLSDLFGFGAYIWPLFFLVMGGRLVSAKFEVAWWRWLGFLGLWMNLMTACEAYSLGRDDLVGGGALGAFVYAHGHNLFSPAGFTLLWVFVFLASMALAFGISWLSLSGMVLDSAGKAGKELAKKAAQIKLPKAAPQIKQTLMLPNMDGLKGRMAEKEKNLPALDTSAKPAAGTEKEAGQGAEQKNEPALKPKNSDTGPGKSPAPQEQKPAPPKTLKERLFGSAKVEATEPSHLPALSLLAPPDSSQDIRPDQSVLDEKGQALMQCLQDFGIEGQLADITPGPVVTMFAVRPAAGVKVSRFSGLSNDIAMAMRAVAVRVEAPIPGTDKVGVEIPNEKRSMVNFRDLLEGEAFKKSSSLLTMALGKDISGRPMTAELDKMPHLLVAGATGAGKSVCLNSIIVSMLYKASPHQVQMLMIDPKRVELAVYANLPHLVHPVVTEMDLAKNALMWALDEMEDRYKRMGLLGVRNIAAYNEKLATLPEPRPENLEHLEPLPFMVIIVDELADLMMTKGKEVEGCIVRLGQLARAAGIHLILATQRPSVDVVTGLIKANFPCRIAFQVTSGHDSRTILDTVGAETLLGRGDMLFKPSAGRLQRLHGAYVSDDEVAAVVKFWEGKAKPSYQVDFGSYGVDENLDKVENGSGNDVLDDPLYAEAMQFVMEQGNRASISGIQRRFRVGFNKAARFVDQMKQDGVWPSGEKR